MGREFTLVGMFETVADVVPDRVALSQGTRRQTYRETAERCRRLASYLHAQGLGAASERADLEGHESGQDHVALLLYNSPEYIEGMLGAYRARTAPFNVNYRYVGHELAYLLRDASTRAAIFHATFAPVLAGVLDQLDEVPVLLQVDDGSGIPLLAGAADYEEALADSDPSGPPVIPCPDDLYILFTGGTTGMPKGVLWRQHDIFMAAMGGTRVGTWETVTDEADLAEGVTHGPGISLVVLPPLMHGGAQWTAFHIFRDGNALVMPESVQHFDAADIWRTVERERAITITVIGDAMVRPLLAELEQNSYDLSSLLAVGNGGAPLTPAMRDLLLERFPNLFITDTVGASETGAQMNLASSDGGRVTTFSPGPDTCVLDDARTRVFEPGHAGEGWLAQAGFVPLGYLGDPDKTAQTFPVIDGIRYSVPGDRAVHLPDGRLQLLGRDSLTINTGGEKVFVEEVESAIAGCRSVADVVVTSRPSERWGQEVVAIIQPVEGETVSLEDVREFASASIAGYKMPKDIVVVERVQRSPSGKADYRWAKEIAAGA